MARLKDGPNFDGEGLAAGIALIDPNAGAFALQSATFIHCTAMRANAALRPDMGLYKDICGGFIVKVLGAENGHGC
jgi:hypothetical protein